MVNFVLTLERKPVEGALINIVSNDGQDASSGKTSDWGEFHTGLALGAYTVSITWNGKTTVQNVNIDITTKRVELRLDPQE